MLVSQPGTPRERGRTHWTRAASSTARTRSNFAHARIRDRAIAPRAMKPEGAKAPAEETQNAEKGNARGDGLVKEAEEWAMAARKRAVTIDASIPPPDSRLLSSQMASAFGIQLMNAQYRYPHAPPPPVSGGTRDSRGSRGSEYTNAPPSANFDPNAGMPRPPMPPPYAGFAHQQPGAPGHANAQAQQAAAAAAAAAISNMYGYHGLAQWNANAFSNAQGGGHPRGMYPHEMYGRRPDAGPGIGAAQGASTTARFARFAISAARRSAEGSRRNRSTFFLLSPSRNRYFLEKRNRRSRRVLTSPSPRQATWIRACRTSR